MIVWGDIESTGLNPKKDHLLEVALVVTDDDLREIASASTIMQPVGIKIDSVEMDPVVREMHTKNGLLDEIRAMEEGKTRSVRRYEAEKMLLDFLRGAFAAVPPVESEKCAHCGQGKKKHEQQFVFENIPGAMNCKADGYHGSCFHPKLVPAVSQTPLAGSTIGFDRSFLAEHMPELLNKVSYRSIDVSSLTELSQRWAPEVYKSRPKEGEESAHRALPDVRVSIEYLRYFRGRGFIGIDGGAVTRLSDGSRLYGKIGEHCPECGPRP
jgi:oligoribonuclease